MKNLTTPRNLSDCSFSIGYPTVEKHTRPKRLSPLAWFCIWFTAMYAVLTTLMLLKVI